MLKYIQKRWGKNGVIIIFALNQLSKKWQQLIFLPGQQ